MSYLAPGQSGTWKVRIKADKAGRARLSVRLASEMSPSFEEVEGTLIVW